MRDYSIFSCPRCAYFEYRRDVLFGGSKGSWKLFCHAGGKKEELAHDSKGVLTDPPPTCVDFERVIKSRKPSAERAVHILEQAEADRQEEP